MRALNNSAKRNNCLTLQLCECHSFFVHANRMIVYCERVLFANRVSWFTWRFVRCCCNVMMKCDFWRDIRTPSLNFAFDKSPNSYSKNIGKSSDYMFYCNQNCLLAPRYAFFENKSRTFAHRTEISEKKYHIASFWSRVTKLNMREKELEKHDKYKIIDDICHCAVRHPCRSSPKMSGHSFVLVAICAWTRAFYLSDVIVFISEEMYNSVDKWSKWRRIAATRQRQRMITV